MLNSGKYGEFLVMTELLKRDIEAYQAVKINQEDYDITVVRSTSEVIRVQVKTTELQNGSTNNAISNIDKNYDILVIVIVDPSGDRHFVLTKDEVLREKAAGNQIYISQKTAGTPQIRQNLIQYEGQWSKI
uniref:hypothetical protein n=1 Tax=Microbulbifer agarilyticus TaxID=260552 RepID=UPI00025582F5|nr:hypothetical protein [Microbulbifer agarilyticus]